MVRPGLMWTVRAGEAGTPEGMGDPRMVSDTGGGGMAGDDGLTLERVPSYLRRIMRSGRSLGWVAVSRNPNGMLEMGWGCGRSTVTGACVQQQRPGCWWCCRAGSRVSR